MFKPHANKHWFSRKMVDAIMQSKQLFAWMQVWQEERDTHSRFTCNGNPFYTKTVTHIYISAEHEPFSWPRCKVSPSQLSPKPLYKPLTIHPTTPHIQTQKN
jgi:hypothetical protein